MTSSWVKFVTVFCLQVTLDLAQISELDVWEKNRSFYMFERSNLRSILAVIVLQG